jgi:hypothetical protein
MIIKGLFQRLMLASVLAIGFLVVWGVVAFWAAQMYVGATLPRDKILQFLRDGTPRLALIDPQYGETQCWDLEGNLIPPADPENAAMAFATPLPAALTEPTGGCDTAWDQRVFSFRDGQSPFTYWYFVSDRQPNGTGYFVGYDSKSCGCVGYLGTAGFRTAALPAEELIPLGRDMHWPTEGVLCPQNHLAFSRTNSPVPLEGRAPPGCVSSCDVYVVSRGGRIYHADLQKRTMQVAVDDPQLCSAALVFGLPDPLRGIPQRLVARSYDAVSMLDDRGQALKRYPIPEPLRGWDLHFAETTAGEALMYWNSPRDELAMEVQYRIYWVAPNGRFRESTVTLPLSGELRELRVLGAAVAPSPFVLGGIVALYVPWVLREEGLMEGFVATYEETLGRMTAEFWPALVIAQLLAAGFAVLCYRRQTRYRASGCERVVWPLFVLALGLPGWVAYRFGQTWPVLETCPACGASVPRDRGECAHCDADFPGPALKGTEVFA